MTGLIRPPKLGSCLLCGAERAEVERRLVLWPDTKVWGEIESCLDRAACRDRVEALGERWPTMRGDPPRRPGGGGLGSSEVVAGQGPRGRRLSGRTGSETPAGDDVALAEPMEPVAVPAADAAEENWFR